MAKELPLTEKVDSSRAGSKMVCKTGEADSFTKVDMLRRAHG